MQQDTGPAVSTDTDGGSEGVSRASQLLHTSDMEDSVMQVTICTLATALQSVHLHKLALSHVLLIQPPHVPMSLYPFGCNPMMATGPGVPCRRAMGTV